MQAYFIFDLKANKRNLRVMAYLLDITIECLPKTPNSIGKASIWQSHGERHKWRKEIAFHTLGKVPDFPIKLSNLYLTRCSSRQPDIDNLYSSFKFVIDALKYNKIIEDDKPSNFSEFKCSWQKAKKGSIRIRLEAP